MRRILVRSILLEVLKGINLTGFSGIFFLKNSNTIRIKIQL